jgi:N-acyl-D-aspartate/D-glutamate deacylase
MTYDLLIKNGTVVDGTGAPKRHADVAIKNGRIVEIGKVKDSATQVIDAEGQIVCPGFVDPHTHYDAQITWDRLLSSSAEHGVTTAVMGNCGVGIAPCKPEARELLIGDLVNVEGMEKEVLSAGIHWDFETFPEYMASAEKHGGGINRAFLAPLAPLRTYVMGAEATERAATPAETHAITTLIEGAIKAGAVGFSTTAMLSHIGHGGKPFAARVASRDELAAYCGVLKKAGRGVIEMALTKQFGRFQDDEYELLDFMLTHSNRPVTWLSLHNMAERPSAVQEVLEKAAPLIARGGIPQILTRPLVSDMNLQRPFQLSEMSSAKGIFNASFEQQMKIYADPAFRSAFKEELKQGRKWSSKGITVFKVSNPKMKQFEGATIGDIAQNLNKDPDTVFFDMAVEDMLEMKCVVPRANTDRARIAEVLNDSRTMIGLSDAGAHVDMFAEAGYTTYLLGHWVRDQQALSMEAAVKRITQDPADYFGFKDRGRLTVGAAADVVVFDADKIGSPERASLVRDLPAGGARMVAKASGISHVVVNGAALYRDGKHTGDFPGHVLRSA